MDHRLLQRIAAERPYLFALASRWLRNPERSEDAVQSALAAGVAGAAAYRGSASLRTWLTAILRNRIIDEQRRRVREPLAADLVGAEACRSPAPALADPLDEMQALQTAERMAERLQSLPTRCAHAFVMRELEGRSSPEIRRRLSLTPGQFWQCIHKARRELQAAATS